MPKHRHRGLLVGTLVFVVLMAGGATAAARALGIGPFEDPQQVNRVAQRPPYVDPESSAALALARARAAGDPATSAFQVLAQEPAGIWVTPERHPLTDVGSYVTSVVQDADAAGQVPVLVIYGIPDRDCDAQLSAGGLAAEQYLPWVQAIASAAGQGAPALVILEPDALAAAVACNVVDQRVTVLRSAVDALRSAGVTTYVDAGHSSWVPVAEMARMLHAVGTETVRGFATNVSNFQTTKAEMAYAQALSQALQGAHFVIDTGRNGNGATDDWCNPSGRALGARPGYVDDGTPLDALLWIKPPGESDGSCGGGPGAGEFWPRRALDLVSSTP